MPLSKEDQQRIEQAATEYFKIPAQYAIMLTPTMSVAELYKDREKAFVAGAEYECRQWEERWRKGTEINQEWKSEAEGWQQILSQKDKHIKELVEGLERCKNVLDAETFNWKFVNDIKELLTKHKKQ